MTLLVRKADAVARVVRTIFALTLSVCKECTASDGKCTDTPRPEGRCLDTLRPDARCRGSCVRVQVPWRVASRRTVPWRVATRRTVPWPVASRRTVPWPVASRRTVPWRAASLLARFRPLRLERLVRPDTVDANIFFPDVLALEHACHLLIGESLVDINTSKAGILQLRHRMTQELMAGHLTDVEQVAIPLAEDSPLQSPTSAVHTPFATVHSRFMAVETLSPRLQSLPITAQIISSAVQTPSPSSGMRSPIIPVQTPSPGPQCPPIVVQIASSATQTPFPGVQGPLIAMQILSVLSGFLSNAFTMCVTEILSLLPHQNFMGKN